MIGLLYLIVALAVLGFCLYLVMTYVPMPQPFKQALVVIVVIAIVLYLAQRFLAGPLSLVVHPAFPLS